jgi:two-component system osmolarity sensor histidine kinase EnvZ
VENFDTKGTGNFPIYEFLSIRMSGRAGAGDVRDACAGSPADQPEKVFRPFYRLEGARSQATGGTGLGLAIVRQLAETNGWTVDLFNRPQGGLEAVLEIRR